MILDPGFHRGDDFCESIRIEGQEMCGIAGIYRRRGLNDSDPRLVQAMTEAIAHRGPDDFGCLLLDSRDGGFQLGRAGFEPRPCDVCLGCRRLAIIDLTTNARQPVCNETGDIFLVFNGEIFNYIELRRLLESKGHVFRSRSDTEVVVHAYEEWGGDCVERFNGMWALALWDQRKRELFCSRDRFGIKPFYYRLDDRSFLFASEIKGLLPALGSRPRPDYGVLRDYLAEASLCRTRDTFLEGVKRLEPAHNLVVTADRVRTDRYWDYHARSRSHEDRPPVETFRELLYDAVALRLRSDVPVGMALSGGLDSTSVLACAARRADAGELKAFTAVFPGESYNEQEYARLACQALGAQLFCVDYQPGHFVQDLREVTWCLDYPAVDGQVLLRRRLMDLAGRHVKVILEGQGADEMLAGYICRYFTPYLLDELERLTSKGRLARLKKLSGACLDMHRRHGWPRWRLFLRRIWRSLHGPERRAAPEMPFSDDFLNIRKGRPEAPWVPKFEDRLTNRMHFEHAAGVLPLLLKYGDALSMAASIESRLPFLDHRLVEFVFQLPAHHKLDGSLTKVILRNAMAGAIPERILSRRDKIGFITPLSKWIGHCMDSDIRPLLLSRRCKERGILDTGRVDEFLSLQAAGKAGMEYPIFRWLSVELWFRMFIDGEGKPPMAHPGASP